ncbi:hypothetical protein T07_242 [Trichinella nelsoni]|uniref:Uncharacterized protein n=1 Tax=Trichinella nelsoni TaxID=6336 RepID=A0A0V0RWJ7_9BILA|nr:hypothetical protein T07_242 [Trichinella nelsoni]
MILEKLLSHLKVQPMFPQLRKRKQNKSQIIYVNKKALNLTGKEKKSLDQFNDELKKVGSQSYVDDAFSRIIGKQQTFFIG